MFSSHMALLREGHLGVVLKTVSYIMGKHNYRLDLDPTYPDIDHASFKKHKWVDFYCNVKEAIPTNMTEPRGKDVYFRRCVDSNHIGYKSTLISRTGFLIYKNMALIQWLSKRQPTIETSVFGVDFVAMKKGMETLRLLWYKLRMTGVPISRHSCIYRDNMSVIYNTQRPESTLRINSKSIFYHAIRECVAMGDSLTTHIPTNDNTSD